MVPYVSAVVAVTVMRIQLFVLHVCMLREYEGAMITKCWCGGWIRCGCGECMVCGWYTWFRYCV